MQGSVKIELTQARLDKALLNINFGQTLKAMELMKRQYTHLDPLPFESDGLPIELFISYEKWIGSLSRRVKRTK